MPARYTAGTLRPANKRTALGTGQRSCGWRTSTLDITRPARCAARPRRVTSISGSSGIPACLCGAPNIPNIGRTQMFIRLLVPLAVTAVLGIPGAALAQPDAKELNEPTLYELLLGEIALQRGDNALAAKTYLELARRTGDARVARRAVEVANQAKLPELALEAAKTWQEIQPESPAALQVVAALLVSAKRIDEAEPYLEKLLSAKGIDLERGFLQLNRLLAGNPDKAANLRVVRQLAAAHPQIASAHLAVAQASAAASDDAQALAAARRAAQLRPEWEAPAVLEAQVLQKRSTGDAAKRLAQFVEKNPNSREGRLNYARALVLDKRVPEARKQFESLLAANPGNTDLIYTVGLLAFQLKDYPVAEDNMKRLVDNANYRDPDGARFMLGQIAEEQKQWPRAVEWYQQIQDAEHALLPEARDLIEKALELAPEDYFIVDSLGWVQYRQGDLKGAAETLRRAWGGRPDAEIGAHLGEVLWVLGDRGEANRIWQESLKSAPDNETLLKTIKRLRR